MFEYLLPIGSVVQIKDAVKKTMIIGYMQIGAKNSQKLYDYAGVIYPIGSFGANSQFLFDHADIQDIIFTGYKNPEFDEIIKALEKKAADDPQFAETIKTKIITENESE